MKSKWTLWFPLLFITVAARADDASPSAPPKPDIHVACVGDSITQGVGVKYKTNSYPAQLGRLLGQGWEVRNFGVSGTTMMSKGDRPYDKRKEYQAALDSKPDIVVIALGTNDSKPQNIDTNSESFLPSYKDMIGKFRAANPKIKIYACLPVPAFPEHWGIRDSVITNQIIPMIQRVAKEETIPVIDLHTALAGKDSCFPDLVHPNEEGAALMANAVYEAIAPASK